MKKIFKFITAITFATTLLVNPFLSSSTALAATTNQMTKEINSTIPANGYFSMLELDSRTISNGQTIIWAGTNNEGYLLPKCNMSFQINVDPNYDVAIQMIIYKKNSSGQFVEIQKIFTTANKGSGVSIGAGGIVDSGYYAVGVRSFTLNTVTLSGYLMCDFD